MTLWGSEEGEEEFTCPFSDLAQCHIVVSWWLEEKYNEKKKKTNKIPPHSTLPEVQMRRKI